MASRSTPTGEIADAFARIEEELMASMVRNLRRHRAEEAEMGIEWAQWQAVQLESLDAYARANVKRYGKRFDVLNAKMRSLVENEYREAATSQEREILKAVAAGFVTGRAEDASFFKAPSERLDALLGALQSDMMRAEHAVLRRAHDQYRQVIFDAQVYAASGAGTYAKAVDMATRDFLAKGIDGIVYRNGSRHTIGEYAEMAIRTSTKRAALVAEGDMRREWGINTVVVDRRDDACPECMEWVGEVLVDDVYGGGTAEEAERTGYRLLSEAMDAGLFHPNCRDTTSTWFPGVSETPERPTRAEQAKAEAREGAEQAENSARNTEARYERLAEYSLDDANRERYAAKAEEWGEKAEAVRRLEGRMAADGDRIEWPAPDKQLSETWLVRMRAEYGKSGVGIHPSFDNARVDKDAVSGMLSASAAALDKIPELSEAFGGRPLTLVLDYGMDSNDFGMVMPNKPWMVHLNEKAMRDNASLKAEYGALADIGWFVKGTGEEAIVYHELGHLLDKVYNIDPEAIAMKVLGASDRESMAVGIRKELSEYAANKLGSDITAEVMAAWLGGVDNRFANAFMREVLAL